MTKPNNPPAFSATTGSDGGIYQKGMSLRDYFAAKAMLGLAIQFPQDFETDAENLVKLSWKIAELMLLEREKDNS